MLFLVVKSVHTNKSCINQNTSHCRVCDVSETNYTISSTNWSKTEYIILYHSLAKFTCSIIQGEKSGNSLRKCGSVTHQSFAATFSSALSLSCDSVFADGHRSGWCTFRCLINVLAWANLRSQYKQKNGFSPVCVLIWTCRAAFCTNDASHCSQTKFRSPVWVRICIFKLPDDVNVESQ